MIKLKPMVSELIVKDLTKKKSDRKLFLAFQDKLFIFDDKTGLGSIKKHLEPHPGVDKTSKYSVLHTTDAHSLATYAAEIAPDVVAGSYMPAENWLDIDSGAEVQPRTSLTVRKIVKQLGIKKITRNFFDHTTQDDVSQNYSKAKVTGKIPSIMYHGTDSQSLKSILKWVLDPESGKGRFKDRGVEHYEHVFLSSQMEDSIYYAFNAVGKEGNRYDNFPIVLELSVPDQSLLDPDYDADVSTTTPRTYDHSKPPHQVSSMKAMGLSRETGKFGYKGRIPAKFIRWVYYYNTYQKKWHRSRPDVWAKLLDKYDWETIGYKLGLFSNDLGDVRNHGAPKTFW